MSEAPPAPRARPPLTDPPPVESLTRPPHPPGRAVEVRVPPYGVTQAVAGTVHRRGTPPSVVETDAGTWLALATGGLAWDQAVAEGALHASGERCDLSAYLPLLRV